MKEEIEKRRAEAAEKKKQKEEDTAKPAFAISPKGSSKVSMELWLILQMLHRKGKKRKSQKWDEGKSISSH